MSSLASLIANVKSNTAGNSLVKKNLAVTKKRQAASDPAGKTTKKAKSVNASTSKHERSTPKVTKAGEPQVIVFDGSALTKRPTMESKAAKKAFLAGKANIEDIPSDNVEADSNDNDENENENLRKDKELQQLLATSRLLEEYQVDEMSGKERRKHMFGKMEELGMKGAKKEKRSLDMHLGMASKKKERQYKKLQEAKDMGLYDKSLRHLYVDTKKKERKRDPGVTTGVGRLKGATLTLSKHDLSRLNGSSKGGEKK